MPRFGFFVRQSTFLAKLLTPVAIFMILYIQNYEGSYRKNAQHCCSIFSAGNNNLSRQRHNHAEGNRNKKARKRSCRCVLPPQTTNEHFQTELRSCGRDCWQKKHIVLRTQNIAKVSQKSAHHQAGVWQTILKEILGVHYGEQKSFLAELNMHGRA